jgi:hypothetical protein
MQARAIGHTDDRAVVPRPGWLASAFISGFVATIGMLLLFLLAYGLARVVSALPFGGIWGAEFERRQWGGQLVRVGEAPLVAIPGGETLHTWLYNLTHNRLIDASTANVYEAAALYLAGGLIWAVVYAVVAEPRLSGPGWRRGVLFSLVPGILSVVVFLPLVGAGMLGMGLGAGPLPVIGNLLLHLGYGAILGHVYGPFGDLDADTLGRFAPASDRPWQVWSERMAARGVLVGLVLGSVLGILGAIVARLGPDGPLLGQPVAALALSSAVLGATFGGVVGSFLGLSTPNGGRRPA